MIDLFLEKVRSTEGKGLDKVLLYHVFAYTENYMEVKFIIDFLNNYCKKVSMQLYDVELTFTEDYNDAREIFKHFSNVKLNTQHMKDKQRRRYLHLINSADTVEQIVNVFDDMKVNEIEPSIACYVELIKNQSDYKSAKKLFEKYILITEYKRIQEWKENEKIQDGLKHILGVLYLKAQSNLEVNEIKAELSQCHMSTNVEDYLYLKDKSCRFLIKELKKSIRNCNKSTEVIWNYIFSNIEDKKTCINDENTVSIKEKRSYYVYKRNKNIVDYLKRLYDNTCQICGKRLKLKEGYYSEVHHIHPLHLDGPDILENMIVLCPNHHVLFDKGCININLEKTTVSYLDGKEDKIKLLKHNILNECIIYNNEKIYNTDKIGMDKKKNNKVRHKSQVILLNTDTKEEIKITIPSEIKEDD